MLSLIPNEGFIVSFFHHYQQSLLVLQMKKAQIATVEIGQKLTVFGSI